MVLDIPHLVEYSVEIGYGLIYLILAITTIKKYKDTQNPLVIYFFAAFMCLSLSGLYGGIAGVLNKTGFEWIPVFGDKILEIYEGLALVALIFFVICLVKI